MIRRHQLCRAHRESLLFSREMSSDEGSLVTFEGRRACRRPSWRSSCVSRIHGGWVSVTLPSFAQPNKPIQPTVEWLESDSSSTMIRECVATHGVVSPLATSFHVVAPLISPILDSPIEQSTQFPCCRLGDMIYNSPIHVDTYPLLGSTHFTMKKRHMRSTSLSFTPHPLTWFRLYG